METRRWINGELHIYRSPTAETPVAYAADGRPYYPWRFEARCETSAERQYDEGGELRRERLSTRRVVIHETGGIAYQPPSLGSRLLRLWRFGWCVVTEVVLLVPSSLLTIAAVVAAARWWGVAGFLAGAWTAYLASAIHRHKLEAADRMGRQAVLRVSD
jgi:hypothetical protein